MPSSVQGTIQVPHQGQLVIQLSAALTSVTITRNRINKENKKPKNLGGMEVAAKNIIEGSEN